MSIFARTEFHDEQAAYDYVEARMWPNGPTCPKCGEQERVSKMGGKSTRIGAYKCYKCRKPFTVKVGTIFESSHVKMHLWLQAIFLIAGSKKGISSNQLHRILGVTLKTAWFMSHRIREAMRTGDLSPFGAGGGAVEVDETFIGQDPDAPAPGKRANYNQMNKVLSLVDRETGQVRSMVVDRLSAAEIGPILAANISKEARLMTDEARFYLPLGKAFAEHGIVAHARDEYVRGDVYTNTVEGCFSIFKRGMRGVYQHCAKKHLHRYLAEFDFRYSNRQAKGIDDERRANAILSGALGKRLTYETTGARSGS